MDIEQVVLLTAYLHELYGDKFPKLSPAMTKIWYEDLARMDNELMEQTVNRWARQHTLKSPSLDELLEQAEFLQEEQRRRRRPSAGDTSPLDVLRAAAEAQARNPERSASDGTFGHLMALIGERSVARWVDEAGVVHDKLTLEERATTCYEWARTYQTTHPKLADDLQYTARTYARIYHGHQD